MLVFNFPVSKCFLELFFSFKVDMLRHILSQGQGTHTPSIILVWLELLASLIIGFVGMGAEVQNHQKAHTFSTPNLEGVRSKQASKQANKQTNKQTNPVQPSLQQGPCDYRIIMMETGTHRSPCRFYIDKWIFSRMTLIFPSCFHLMSLWRTLSEPVASWIYLLITSLSGSPWFILKSGDTSPWNFGERQSHHYQCGP